MQFDEWILHWWNFAVPKTYHTLFHILLCSSVCSVSVQYHYIFKTYLDWFSASRPISSSYKRFNHASTTSKSDFLWFFFHIGLFKKDLHPHVEGILILHWTPLDFKSILLWPSGDFLLISIVPYGNPRFFSQIVAYLLEISTTFTPSSGIFFLISSAGVLQIFFFWKSLLTGLTLFLNWNLILIEWWYIDKLGVTLTTKFYYH